ncbi:MAG: NADH:ubiquinone oxidoreductase subunit J [Methylococcaceae bacterium TMED69]|nr:MAG: NADH:ubiquinone oxidoreductase subunit J [Methylococcaceae bacterium TMED69]|tara:strand:+ start:542 stop:1135 length:594 start_codon:yes stop_codon:yes gene_type:complete
MTFEQLVFYGFAGLTLVAGLSVVSLRNPVHAALALILCFFSTAGLWLLMEAEFLAIALVLVYVGAVMVLFMFVVMMLDINIEETKKGFGKILLVAMILTIPMVVAVGTVMNSNFFKTSSFSYIAREDVNYNNTREIGLKLFTDYILLFEIASLILLVAIIAAIALTLRTSRQTKAPNVDDQVSVRRDDRVKLIDVKE